MIVKHFIPFLIFILPTLLYGQTKYESFLIENDIYRQAEKGAVLIDYYRENNVDSLKIISIDLIEFGKRKKNDFAMAIGLNGYGKYAILTGKVESGLICFKKSLHYFEKQEDYSNVSILLNEIGNAYLLHGEIYNALESFRISLKVGAHSPEYTDAFNGEIGMSKCFFALGDTIKGLQLLIGYKNKALMNSKYESAAIASAYLSTIEQDRDNVKDSQLYLEESIAYGEKSKSLVQLANSLTNKAILCFQLDKVDSSLVFFEDALNKRQQLGRPRLIVESYFNLASFYVFNEDYPQAISMISESIELARKNELLLDEYDGTELLAYIYEEQNDFENLTLVKQNMIALSEAKEKRALIDEEWSNYIESIQLEKIAEPLQNKKKTPSYVWVIILSIIVVIGVKGLLKRKTTS